MVALGWICNYGSALEDENGGSGSRWVCKSFFWCVDFVSIEQSSRRGA